MSAPQVAASSTFQSHRKLWLASVLVTLLCSAGLVYTWKLMDGEYVPPDDQLVDATTVAQQLDAISSKRDLEGRIFVPTGVFLQSLEFNDSSNVNITGYVWQTYDNEAYPELAVRERQGFVFPEAVNSALNGPPQEVYREAFSKTGELHPKPDPRTATPQQLASYERLRLESVEHVTWYFEATLRQNFDYSAYPFDHKTAWLRIWHKEFARNVVLKPDLDVYNATGVDDKFGIEEDIVLGGWSIVDTYFDYLPASYDTDFGIPNYVGQWQFPELRFNVVLRRNFRNAFFINFLPLLTVTCLLFATLLSVTSDPDRERGFGLSLTGMIGSCSALFFVVMLSHGQLRRQFGGSDFLYIEKFYLLTYAAILATSLLGFLYYSRRHVQKSGFVFAHDALYPKLLFWPGFTLLGLLITLTSL